MAGVGKEHVRSVPFQDHFFIINSHNQRTGDFNGYANLRNGQVAWRLLNANEVWTWELFMIDGRHHMNITFLSDVAGSIYVHQGVDPYRVNSELNANAWLQLPYVSVNITKTWRVPCRSNICKISYANGASDQTVFEFSVELMNQ